MTLHRMETPMSLPPELLRRAADLLDAYGDNLACRGCNDYPVDANAEGVELDRLVREWSGDPDYEPTNADGKLYLLDWMVAHTLATLIRRAVDDVQAT